MWRPTAVCSGDWKSRQGWHPNTVYILYHCILLSHVDGHMKEYVKTHNCRQKELLKYFDCFGYKHDVPHLCCDNYAALCHCGL